MMQAEREVGGEVGTEAPGLIPSCPAVKGCGDEGDAGKCDGDEGDEVSASRANASLPEGGT